MASEAPKVVLALLSGVLLGLAFPPVDAKWLAWVGLIPLLWAVDHCDRPRRAFALGYLAGFVFFLLTLHPLVSAHAWTGWAVESQAQFAARLSRQWWFLHGVWVSFALWGAVFWGCWAALVRVLVDGRPWRSLLVVPALWIVLTEWIRAQTTFGFTWAFLGYAAADIPVLRQLAALGGVWLLSAIVVLVNAGAAELSRAGRSTARRWRLLWAVVGCVGLAIGYGLTRHPVVQEGGTVPVAVLQYTKPSYVLTDFLPIGLDKAYPRMVSEALAHGSRLMVLPESIALGAMSLDGSSSPTKPKDRQTARSHWEAAAHEWLTEPEAVVVLGLDTIEGARDHNTLVAWSREGTVGWYHKRGLVPFSEYVPSGWARIAIRGQSQYSPGQGSQLIRINEDLVLGGFICQEVLLPELIRRSAHDGATVLVTGGNDGVFADPAIAMIHADASQLRAVETGRFIVRAMKTGVSAVIDPMGRELVRSRSAEPTMLLSQITPLTGQTPYVRFGDWVLWASLAIMGTFLFPKKMQSLSTPRKK